jgi:hypothetical protein
VLEQVGDLPVEIIGVRAEGEVCAEDYVRCFRPIVANARREGHGLRLLYELGEDLDAVAEAIAWEDLRVGIETLRCFEGCAIISDSRWIHEATRSVSVACPLRAFGRNARSEAIAWLQALPVMATAVSEQRG